MGDLREMPIAARGRLRVYRNNIVSNEAEFYVSYDDGKNDTGIGLTWVKPGEEDLLSGRFANYAPGDPSLRFDYSLEEGVWADALDALSEMECLWDLNLVQLPSERGSHRRKYRLTLTFPSHVYAVEFKLRLP